MTDSGLTGLFLFLQMSILMLVRWRFPKMKWTLAIDQAIVFIAAATWESGAYFLTLSVFEAVYLGYPIIALPALYYCFLYKQEPYFCLMLIQGFFAGFSLWGWQKYQKNALKRIDEDRKRYYEAESLKQDLLNASIQTAKMAELSERSRIARDIHDHAGHEIIAAYLSLQTAQVLLKDEPEQAEDMLGESLVRLEHGIDKIRETVQNLAPIFSIGVESLRKLCGEFKYCPVKLQVYGDASKVPVYLWSILEPCLKEALTNIVRHSEAKNVRATLDITPSIVRLCVENDGVDIKTHAVSGLGLRNLQQRAAAVGGNISTNISKDFRLVCVLPIR